MTAEIIVALAAFVSAGLTMYSGFGLGTLMLPVFAMFFPVEIAVLSIALVHGDDNIIKVAVLGRHADRAVVIRFGLPAMFAALIGAMVLVQVSSQGIIHSYELLGRTADITPVRLLIGILIFIFAVFELWPGLRRFSFDRKYLPLGGVLSGFFGGLSGHQGALRSAFLSKAGLSTEQFVGSNAVIGMLVDLTRVATYAGMFAVLTRDSGQSIPWSLVLIGSLAAFCAVMIARRYLHKVTMKAVQTLVGALLLAVAIGMMTGLI